MNQLHHPPEEPNRELSLVKAPGELSLVRPRYIDAMQTDSSNEIDSQGLLEYWRILRRNKKTILLITFLGTLIGLLVSLPQTPVYNSRTRLEIQSLNENILNTSSVDPNAQVDSYYTAETNIPTQINILEGDTLISRALAKLNPEKRPESPGQKSRISAWRKALSLFEARSVSPREDALDMASESLEVRGVPRTRIVEVTCDSTDPQAAADFANTLVNEFIEQNIEDRIKSAQRTGQWLNGQISDLKMKLEKSEDQLQTYARFSGLLFTGEKGSVHEEKLRQMLEEVTKAQAERVTKQSQYEMATSSPPEALPEVLDDGTLKEYKAKLTDLRRQLAELGSTFTPTSYKIQRVQAQISELLANLEKERVNILKRIGNEYQAAQRRENLLATGYASQAKLVSDLAAKGVHYNILKQEVDTNRQVYDAILQRVKEYGIASAMRASNVRVIEPAVPPAFPYKPNPLQSSELGFFAGGLLGMLFVFIRERSDRSLQVPGDAALYLNVPELGAIPKATADPYKVVYGKRQRVQSIPGENEPEMGKPSDNQSNGNEQRNGKAAGCVELVTWQRKPSLLAESFRSTLASILFSAENGSRPRVIVLTSCGAMEGKTTTISNLAIALAEINYRVLLVDADMRKPRLHEVFGLSNSSGLSDLLLEQSPVEEYPFEALARNTQIRNLFVLPSGSETSSISNLLFSPRLPELLNRFRREFETVLIDTPPMLQISDARVLGRLADGVILVFFANHTTRDTARAAVQRFREDSTPLIGTILNHWDPRGSTDYGSYGRYYHYYSKEKDS